MKKWSILFVAFLALVGFQQAALADASALKPCKNCHDISPGMKKVVGPPLFGVFGRAPTIEGVPFKAWDEKSLDEWEANPQKVKKGAKMLYKTSSAEKRAAIIAALKELK